MPRKNIWIKIAFGLALAIGLAVTPQPALADGCDSALANRVAKAIFTIENWRNLYVFYSKYESCDELTVADGFADRGSDLLANHWETLPDLVDQIAQHPAFSNFMIAHLSRDLPPNRLATILNNAENHCPADQTELCTRIALRVRKILP